MFITYLDDAGTVGSDSERHYILAGVCIHEAQVFYLDDALDNVARAVGFAENPRELELHGNAILARKGVWRKFRRREEARKVILSALLAGNKAMDWRLFGVVVDKARCEEDPAEYAFEQICGCFDHYLSRRNRKPDRSGNITRHRGLLVLDKSTRETRLQALTTRFRQSGHRRGNLRHFADVPFFVDSKATRLVQYADLVCYALWRKYEKDDPEFFDAVADKFYSENGAPRGLLYHPPSPPAPVAAAPSGLSPMTRR